MSDVSGDKNDYRAQCLSCIEKDKIIKEATDDGLVTCNECFKGVPRNSTYHMKSAQIETCYSCTVLESDNMKIKESAKELIANNNELITSNKELISSQYRLQAKINGYRDVIKILMEVE